MPGAVVILAVAGNGQVGIDGDVVFRLAGERAAIEFLAGDFGAQFEPARFCAAHEIADAPVEARLRIFYDPRCRRRNCHWKMMASRSEFSKRRVFLIAI